MTRFFVGLAVVVVSGVTGSQAWGQFDDLTLRLPGQMNTLILFDVDKIMNSPMAQKEGWRENHEKMFAAGILLIPPQANRFAMAANLDFEIGQTVWESAVMDLKYEPSMPKVAARYGGQVDKIADRNTAALPSDTYVVEFGKRVAGMMIPGNRQRVAQWIQQVYSPGRVSPLTTYLKEAQGFAERNAQVVMSLDLNNVVGRGAIRPRLEELESIQGRDIDLDQLADVLASIRGVTLAVSIKDNVIGGLKVDFGKDATIMKDYAKALLLEVLANQGAMINEFNEWDCVVEGKQVRIQGRLYSSGRQRIMSLVETPPGLQDKQPPSEEEASEQVVALATQQYFNSMTQLVRDLKEHRDGGKTSGQIGLWYQKYASRIDNLPILNVDPELVEWSSHVSAQLRQGETAMKGIGARQAVRESNIGNVQAYNYAYAGGGGYRSGRWGGWSGGGYAYGYRQDGQTALSLKGQERARVRREEKIRGNTSANLIMQGLEAEFGEVRKRLTQKYQVEFQGL